MSAEPWQPPRDVHASAWEDFGRAWREARSLRWWQRVLETDWATVEEIDREIGPMYRMFEEQL